VFGLYESTKYDQSSDTHCLQLSLPLGQRDRIFECALARQQCLQSLFIFIRRASNTAAFFNCIGVGDWSLQSDSPHALMHAEWPDEEVSTRESQVVCLEHSALLVKSSYSLRQGSAGSNSLDSLETYGQ
jgi:hypothetical protein